MDPLEFLQNQPRNLYDLARIAAIPNWFDIQLLAALLEPTSAIRTPVETLNQAGILSMRGDEQFTVHPVFRKPLLDSWKNDSDNFRKICKKGFDFLSSEPDPQGRGRELYVTWLARTYFALGANLPNGTQLLEALYNGARDNYQLGICEQVLVDIGILGPFLSQASWNVLYFLNADLSLANYKYAEAEIAYRNAQEGTDDPLRHALAGLGLGRVYLARHNWELAFKELHQAEIALEKLGKLNYRAAAQAAIGNVFDDIAERSGGLYGGNEDRLDSLARFQRSVESIPFLIFDALLHTPVFASIYFLLGLNPRSRFGRILTALHVGSKYQDWVIARLKVQATYWLRMAASTFENINAKHEQADVWDRLVVLYQQLGHYRAARQLQDKLLANPGVQRSDYWQARVQLARGQVQARSGNWENAISNLDAAHNVLAQYADWNRAGTAAILSGQVRLKAKDPRGAANRLQDATKHFEQADDPVRRTEALAVLQVAGKTIDTNETTMFIDQFPGGVLNRVSRPAIISVNGLTWLCTLGVVFLAGMAVQIGEALIKYSLQGTQLTLSLVDLIILVMTPVFPFLLAWVFLLWYTILGGAFWTYRLPLKVIETDLPFITVLNNKQVIRQNSDNVTVDTVYIDNILGIISGERRVTGHLWRIGTKALVVTQEQVLSIEGTTRFYQTLKSQLLKIIPPALPVRSADLDHVTSKISIVFFAILVVIGIWIQPARISPVADPNRIEYLYTWKLVFPMLMLVLFSPLIIFLNHRMQQRQIESMIQQLRQPK